MEKSRDRIKMTNNKIIAKAVNKAQDNGYKNNDIVYFLDHKLWEMIIFSHDFAKAFWGVNYCICNSGSSIPLNYDEIYNHDFEESIYPLLNENKRNGIMMLWEFHLQKMIVDKEPLKYLEKFL